MSDFKLASYNLHGWKDSNAALFDLCSNNDVVFIQEHWLLPYNLDIINFWDSSFNCHVVSGIVDVDNYAMRGGRPYGGIGFLWRKSATFNIKLISVDDQHRLMAIEVNLGKHKIVIIGVYFPCYVNNDDYEGDIMMCVGFIESIF